MLRLPDVEAADVREAQERGRGRGPQHGRHSKLIFGALTFSGKKAVFVVIILKGKTRENSKGAGAR